MRLAIQHVNGERDVSRQLDFNGTIRFDRCIGQNFTHAHAGGAEGRVVDLTDGLVHDFNRLDDSDEARRTV